MTPGTSPAIESWRAAGSETAFDGQLVTRDGGRRVVHCQKQRRRHRDRRVGVLVGAEVPVRLIVGRADPVSGDHVARRYGAAVPAGGIVRLGSGIGHYPQIEDPDGVLHAFLDFAGS